MIAGVQSTLDLRRRRHVGNDGKCALRKQAKTGDWLQDLSEWGPIRCAYTSFPFGQDTNISTCPVRVQLSCCTKILHDKKPGTE